MNDKHTKPYSSWGTDQFVRSGRPTHYDYHGPFTRFFQLATINGDVYIWDFAYFPHPPPGLHELLTTDGKNKYKLAIHDICGDDLAYYHMYMPRLHDFIRHVSHDFKTNPAFFHKNFIDTKNVYEFSNSVFEAKGYCPPANKLSDHVYYSFDIELDKSIPTIAQSWSRHLSYQMIKYLAIDAISVLDICLLWLREKFIKISCTFTLPKLLPNENFLLDTVKTHKSAKSSFGRVPLSRGTISYAEAKERTAAMNRRNRIRKQNRIGFRHNYSSESESDDDDAYTVDPRDVHYDFVPGTSKYISRIESDIIDPTYSTLLQVQREVLPLPDSVSQHKYCIAPKPIPVPIANITASNVDNTQNVFLQTPVTPVPAQIVPMDVDTQANTASSDATAKIQIASTRATDKYLCEMLKNIAHNSRHIVSQDAIKYYSSVLDPTQVNELFNYISFSRDHLYKDAIAFHEDMLNQPGPDPPVPDIAPITLSDMLAQSTEDPCTAIFSRPFSKKSHFSCCPYSGPTDQEVSLNKPRVFLTSSRTLFEIPSDMINKEFTLYRIPPEFTRGQNRTSITIVPLPVKDKYGLEPALVLTLEQVKLIFDVAAIFYENYKKLYSYIPGYDQSKSSCQEFIIASFYKFRAVNSSSHISFLMMEQLRRLIYNLLSNQAYHPRWEQLARIVDLEFKLSDPRAFHDHLNNLGNSILTGGRNLVLTERARNTERRSELFRLARQRPSSIGQGSPKKRTNVAMQRFRGHSSVSSQPAFKQGSSSTSHASIPVLQSSRTLHRVAGYVPASSINQAVLRSITSAPPPISQPLSNILTSPLPSRALHRVAGHAPASTRPLRESSRVTGHAPIMTVATDSPSRIPNRLPRQQPSQMLPPPSFLQPPYPGMPIMQAPTSVAAHQPSFYFGPQQQPISQPIYYQPAQTFQFPPTFVTQPLQQVFHCLYCNLTYPHNH